MAQLAFKEQTPQHGRSGRRGQGSAKEGTKHWSLPDWLERLREDRVVQISPWIKAKAAGQQCQPPALGLKCKTCTCQERSFQKHGCQGVDAKEL
eukprot:1037248-Pelagomonas_calceolata.AAC.6